uniref:Secreted protein n=1 Tax=Caenorhabditis tropicalis TaxID=1561998 RepID=A0A1I7TUS9_9PELO
MSAMKLLILLLIGAVSALILDLACVKCKPLYDTSCQGLDPDDPESCVTLEEANVKYYDGMPPDYSPELKNVPLFTANVCTMTLECPNSTQVYLNFPLRPYAWCEQTGLMPGEWRSGVNWLLSWTVNTDLKCVKYEEPSGEEYSGEGEDYWEEEASGDEEAPEETFE